MPVGDSCRAAGAIQFDDLQSLSGEDAWSRCGLITRIWGTRRLDQQDVHFLASDGAMLNTLGHHKQLARLECDRLARRQCIPRMLNLRSAALREDRMTCRCVTAEPGVKSAWSSFPARRGCLFQAPEEALSSLQVPVNGIADRNRCE